MELGRQPSDLCPFETILSPISGKEGYIMNSDPTAGWVILNGNRIQIKRKQFEKIIDTLDAI